VITDVKSARKVVDRLDKAVTEWELSLSDKQASKPESPRDSVLDLFSESEPELSRTLILMRLKNNGLIFDLPEIDKILTRLVNKDRLRQVGEVYVLAEKAKAEEKPAQAEQRSTERVEREMQEREEVFKRINDSMPTGVLKRDLTKTGAFKFGRVLISTIFG
jgi:hypothetical protein